MPTELRRKREADFNLCFVNLLLDWALLGWAPFALNKDGCPEVQGGAACCWQASAPPLPKDPPAVGGSGAPRLRHPVHLPDPLGERLRPAQVRRPADGQLPLSAGPRRPPRPVPAPPAASLPGAGLGGVLVPQLLACPSAPPGHQVAPGVPQKEGRPAPHVGPAEADGRLLAPARLPGGHGHRRQPGPGAAAGNPDVQGRPVVGLCGVAPQPVPEGALLAPVGPQPLPEGGLHLQSERRHLCEPICADAIPEPAPQSLPLHPREPGQRGARHEDGGRRGALPPLPAGALPAVHRGGNHPARSLDPGAVPGLPAAARLPSRRGLFGVPGLGGRHHPSPRGALPGVGSGQGRAPSVQGVPHRPRGLDGEDGGSVEQALELRAGRRAKGFMRTRNPRGTGHELGTCPGFMVWFRGLGCEPSPHGGAGRFNSLLVQSSLKLPGLNGGVAAARQPPFAPQRGRGADRTRESPIWVPAAGVICGGELGSILHGCKGLLL